MRQYRERRKEGAVVTHELAITSDVALMLEEEGYLDLQLIDNREAVSRAVIAFLESRKDDAVTP